jgi:hypothetical protein
LQKTQYIYAYSGDGQSSLFIFSMSTVFVEGIELVSHNAPQSGTHDEHVMASPCL